MKAIETRYAGPTNSRGSRFIATDCDNNRVTVSYDYALNSDKNHARAARALCDKMGWNGEMIGGSTKRGMAWVFVNSEDRA